MYATRSGQILGAPGSFIMRLISNMTPFWSQHTFLNVATSRMFEHRDALRMDPRGTTSPQTITDSSVS